MKNCRKCGKPIEDKYLFCYICSKESKTYLDQNGYEKYKDSDIPVHRVVVQKVLKRRLNDGAVVHHKNRNKSDNSASNLWVFKNQEEHDKIHKKDALRHGPKASYKGFKK